MLSYSTTILENGIVLSKQLIDKNFTKGIFIKPQYIVIHGTNNTDFGANAKYFRDYMSVNVNLKSSSHYVIDDKNIIQALEDKWRGWHLSDSKSLVSNSNSIGIRLCSNRGNNFNDTMQNAFYLVKKLINKYNIPYENVIRHYDITGKPCPKVIIEENPSLWLSFKTALKNNSDFMDIFEPIYLGKINGILSSLNVKIKPDKYSDVLGSVGLEDEFWIYEEINNWYKIIINHDNEEAFGYVSKAYVDVTDIKEILRKKKEDIQQDLKDSNELEEIYPEEEACLEEESCPEINSTQSLYLEEKLIDIDDIDEIVEVSYNPELIKSKNEDEDTSEETVKNKPIPMRRRGSVTNVDTNIAVKMSPSDKSYAVGYVLDNQKIIVVEKSGKWYKVIYETSIGKREGYIKIKNIKLE